MSDDSLEPGHGGSLAAWVTVWVIIAAFSIGTLFFWLDQPPLVVASAGLALAGVIAGYFLRRAGYGVGGPKSKN